MVKNVPQVILDLANAIKNLISAHYNITGSSSTKGHVKAGGAPQPIGNSLAAGTDNGYYARADHVHTLPIDDALSNISENPVQNKVIKSAIDNISLTLPTNVSDLNNDSNFLTDSDLLNLIYPIGSIYMSVNNVNPATLFGGTWEQIKDKFLLSKGDTYSTNGATGGEAEHILTVSEMPSHTHSTEWSIWNQGTDVTTSANVVSWGKHSSIKVNGVSDTGGGQAHNNMPPYLVVNVWKRTA